MIRVIESRDDEGTPTAWSDFPVVQVDGLSPRMADLMDRDLAEVPEMDVRGFYDALVQIAQLCAEGHNALVAAQIADPEGDPDALATRVWQDLGNDRRTRTMGICLTWAALNAGGRRTTMLDLYDGTVDYIEFEEATSPREPGKA